MLAVVDYDQSARLIELAGNRLVAFIQFALVLLSQRLFVVLLAAFLAPASSLVIMLLDLLLQLLSGRRR